MGFLVITGVGHPVSEAQGVLCATGDRNLREDGLFPGDLGTSGCNRLLACFSTLKLSFLDSVQPMVGEIAYKVDTLNSGHKADPIGNYSTWYRLAL